MISDSQLTQLCAQALAEDDTQRLVAVLEKIRGAMSEKRTQPLSLPEKETIDE